MSPLRVLSGLPATLAAMALAGTCFAQPAAEMLNFEIVEPWSGLVADKVEPHEGRQSGRWENTVENNRINNSSIQGDLSSYAGLSIWVWSGAANDATIAFALLSENPATDRPDFYNHVLGVDWQGWRKVEVPFSMMTSQNSPLGFSQITGFRMASSDYGTKGAMASTVLKFDEMRFVRDMGSVRVETTAALVRPVQATPQRAPGTEQVILDFESVKPIKGLELDSTIVHAGRGSGLWADTVAVDRVSTKGVPPDMAAWDGIRFWIHSSKATYAQVAVVLKSNNNQTEGSDYYQHNFIVDWEGWKDVAVPFRSMEIRRSPVGFSNISELTLASTSYGIPEPHPDTELRFDDLRLYKDASAAGLSPQVASTGEMEWGTALRSTIAKATQDDRLVLVYAYSPESTACKQVDFDVLRDPEVRSLLKSGFECYRFDPTQHEDHKAYFKVTRVPLLMVYNADGTEKFRHHGPIDRAEFAKALGELMAARTAVRP